MFPLANTRALPPKNEKTGSRASTHSIVAVCPIHRVEAEAHDSRTVLSCRKSSHSSRDTVVAVIEHHQLESAAAVGADDVGIMLGVEPVHGISAIHKCEVAIFAQFPKDFPCALAIAIVDLDHPGLVAHRNNQVFIARRIHNRIGVRPVCAERSSGQVEMIEGGQAQTGSWF